MQTRRQFTAEFKARLALEVLKEQRTLTEIASDHQVHPNLLMQWKKQVLECLPAVFGPKTYKNSAFLYW